MSRFSRLATARAIVCLAVVLSAPSAYAGFSTVYDFPQVRGPSLPSGLFANDDGSFYGTTLAGGANGWGSAFRFTPDGALTTLHNCDGSSGGCYSPDGLQDGGDGELYGIAGGGAQGFGMFYRMNPAGAFESLFSFDLSDGYGGPGTPVVLASDGNFYGTTSGVLLNGADSDYGTIYRFRPNGAFTTLFRFHETDGSHPGSTPIEGSDGNFYGTTVLGGINGNGTIYRMTRDGELTTLVRFDGDNGSHPQRDLTRSRDGSYFYGTTEAGGAYDKGTIYRMLYDGALITLVSFDGENGSDPLSGVVEARDGYFYGTTYSGGAFGYGTVFRMRADGMLTAIVSFDKANGAYPTSTPIIGADGNLYGSTQEGGANDAGTIYRVTIGPGKPENFAAVGGDSQVDLNWSAAADAVTYQIYLGHTPQDPNPILMQVGITDTHASLHLASGQTFYFRVRASDGNILGPWSDEVSASTNPEGRLTTDPSSLDFGDQTVGIPGFANTFDIVNSGTVPVSITSILATTGFRAINYCPDTLAPGARCFAIVNFTSSTSGRVFGGVEISSSAGVSIVSLSGNALSAFADLQDVETFGSVRVGRTAIQRLGLSSEGPGTLAIRSITAVGGDLAQSNDCPAQLAAGTSCTITLSFTPTATGTRTGTLNIQSNSGNGAIAAALRGQGVAPAISLIAPPSFGSVALGTTSAPKSVVVTNSGSDTLVVQSAVLGGTASADFVMGSNNCGSVAPGETCMVAVSFKPQIPGTRNATLTIASDAFNGSSTATLNGSGVMPAPIWTTPTPANNSQLMLTATLPFNQALQATDSYVGALVHIAGSSLPAGASVAASDGNPATATFSWTPATSGDFTATVTAKETSTGVVSPVRTLLLHVNKRATAIVAKPEIIDTTLLEIHLRMKATLSVSNPTAPLGGKTVVFTSQSGNFLCSAISDAYGIAACGNPVTYARDVVNRGYVATFAGDTTYQSSSMTGSLIQ